MASKDENETIILPDEELAAFMRWVFTRLTVKDFAQYRKNGWAVTSMMVNEQFREVLFERNRVTAVNKWLYDCFRRQQDWTRSITSSPKQLAEAYCVN